MNGPISTSLGTPKRHTDLLTSLILIASVTGLSLVPLIFNPDFYFYADTPEGAYGQWFELGTQLRSGVWPLMDPAAWMAGNYAAEGQWGLWNPLILLIAIGVSFANNALVVSTLVKILFLLIGATGVYAVARSYGAGPHWAFVAGLAAPFAGFTLFMDATSWVTNEMVWAFSAWTIWALREFLLHRRSIAWPAVLGCLLITVGYVQGTIMLILFYAALIADSLFRRQWRNLRPILMIGVVHGLFALTVYLPGVLTSSVTTRAAGVSNSGFMVLQLSGLATSATGFNTGPLLGWWGPFTNVPLLYIAWFLPLLFLTSPSAIRPLIRRLSTLVLFGSLVLIQATGPSDLGPLRFPARSLPWLAMVLIVITVVAMDRGHSRSPSHMQLGLMIGSALFSAWLVVAATPQQWSPLRYGAFLLPQLAGLVLAWLWCRPHGRLRGWFASQRLRLAVLPVIIVLISSLFVVFQSKSYAPVLQSRSDYPAATTIYRSTLPKGKGEGIVVGSALDLPHDFWGETIFGNSWYLNPVRMQNLYTPVGYATYSNDLCLLYDGRSCEQLLARLFSADPTTDMPLTDLLSLDTVQILASKDRPIDQLRGMTPPAGWHVSEVGAQSITWVRDGAGSAVGEAVWSSPGTLVTQVANSNLSATVHVNAVGPNGGTIVFSRLAWPGYSVKGGSLARQPVRNYLLTIEVPATAANSDVTVTFRPPGWPIVVGAFVLAWLLTIVLAVAQARQRFGREIPTEKAALHEQS